MIHENGTATVRVHGITLTDLTVDLEQRVADAIADAEEQTEREVRADVSSRLRQLEQEKARLITELDALKDAIAPFRHTPEDRDLWQEPYDFIRDVLNAREVGELNGRLSAQNERLSAALAETRDALHQLQEKSDALARGEPAG